MHLMQLLRTFGVVLVASVSSATVAHADSELIGTVLSVQTEKPLSDVVVTVTSPALRGERSAVTGALGRYYISGLPPGVYTLRFDKETFESFSRSDIDLRLESTVQVDVALAGGQDEEIEIPFLEAPPLDKGSTTLGQYVEQGFAQYLAVNRPSESGAERSFVTRADLVPGTQGVASGISIHGASPLENGYVLDGLSTQDPVSGADASPLSIEFLQDYEVLTGGYLPQYGRATGGLLRARTRDGGNEFHGAVFGNWTPGFLEGLRTPVSNVNQVSSKRLVLGNMGNMGATLGGPFVKNKLWFFAGVAPALTRYQQTYITPRSDTSRSYILEQRGLQAMGKLTYLFNPEHQVSLSVITTPSRSGVEGPPFVDPMTGESRSAGVTTDSNFTTTGFHYAGASRDKRLRVDAHLGWSHRTKADGLVGSVTSDFVSSRADFLEAVDRYQGNVQGTWLLNLAGTHVLRAGVDTERLAFEKPDPLPRDFEDEFIQRKLRYTSDLLGGFVQDSWSLFDRVTVNAGVRYDAQRLYREDGRLAFVLDHQLSPRVGLSVEPLAPGRMKLFAHYAKYRGLMPLGPMQWFFLAERGRGTQEPVDPSIVPLSSTEFAAGAEYQLPWGTRLSAHYTHRRLDSAIEDMSLDEGYTLFFGNPGLGLASNFPKAERTHDAVSMILSRTFREGWLAQASYTWSRLYGNYLGPFSGGGTGSALYIETRSLMVNRTGLLPYDRTHTFKLFGAREFRFTQDLTASLGLSYLGHSGAPINYLGHNEVYGAGELFVFPRGSSGERTPWIHVIDAQLGMNYRLGGNHGVSFTLDMFNLFNFQRATQVDELYTYASVRPIEGGKPEDFDPSKVTRVDDSGERVPLTERDLNRNFKQPLQYQPPRQVRLGLRYTF